MKKIGLFGGSFDPIHQGHVEMALAMVEALELDSVILMPTFVPPHKIRKKMAAAAHRLAMCQLMADQHPQLQVSDLEISRKGASFTVDTLSILQEQNPDVQWHLITGADMFTTLRTWYRFDEIARLAVLCTIPRDGTDLTHLLDYAARLTADGIRCYVHPTPVTAVSSTQVRQRLASGESLAGLVPPAVVAYIREHGLYQSDEESQIHTQDEQFVEIIRARLGDYRFRHSLCVAEEAKRLALRYGAEPTQAYTAGILHDVMKDTDIPTQASMLEEFGVVLDEVEQTSPTLWHARTGEAFLRRILRIEDEELLSAVRYHTTGHAGMTLLERIIFVADFTSADRDYPDVDVMRTLADQSLNEAMLYGVAYTIRDLTERGKAIHPDTLALYDELNSSLENGGQ